MLLDHDLLHIHKLLANEGQPYILRPLRLSKHAEPISIHSFNSENSTAQFGDIYSCHPIYCFYKRVCVCACVLARREMWNDRNCSRTHLCTDPPRCASRCKRSESNAACIYLIVCRLVNETVRFGARLHLIYDHSFSVWFPCSAFLECEKLRYANATFSIVKVVNKKSCLYVERSQSL